jgi:hypothetical protein
MADIINKKVVEASSVKRLFHSDEEVEDRWDFKRRKGTDDKRGMGLPASNIELPIYSASKPTPAPAQTLTINSTPSIQKEAGASEPIKEVVKKFY